MGLFSKIKENFNHDGVKVQLRAPASVSMQDAQLPVTVTIAATTEAVQIKNVNVEIIGESRNEAFHTPTAGANTASQVTTQVVARTQNTDGFALAPGETKQVQLVLSPSLQYT
ncbi:MAG TPA: hypothetical protein VMS08_03145 [Candidatus Saccharimonadia bacterium]|jgi:hypothetical protein|nr:hypothetical protein [Candidatus Saccharimonadia bacterium]